LIRNYQIATTLNPTWYKAWHVWALANFEVITQLETAQIAFSSRHYSTYVVPAVDGFLRSIALSPGSVLQDTLRLLTLWFDYGQDDQVTEAISHGMPTVSIDVWLEVIPQVCHNRALMSEPNDPDHRSSPITPGKCLWPHHSPIT
jgi:FKBP12-rapamycin complex-associated protein